MAASPSADNLKKIFEKDKEEYKKIQLFLMRHIAVSRTKKVNADEILADFERFNKENNIQHKEKELDEAITVLKNRLSGKGKRKRKATESPLPLNNETSSVKKAKKSIDEGIDGDVPMFDASAMTLFGRHLLSVRPESSTAPALADSTPRPMS